MVSSSWTFKTKWGQVNESVVARTKRHNILYLLETARKKRILRFSFKMSCTCVGCCAQGLWKDLTSQGCVCSSADVTGRCQAADLKAWSVQGASELIPVSTQDINYIWALIIVGFKPERLIIFRWCSNQRRCWCCHSIEHCGARKC